MYSSVNIRLTGQEYSRTMVLRTGREDHAGFSVETKGIPSEQDTH